MIKMGALQQEALTLPRSIQSPEARVLGEALVATINAHLQRYSGIRWAEVQAVLQVLQEAAAAETRRESVSG